MPETSPIIIFHEEQRFRQWWVWLMVYGVAALQWWGFIQQIVLGKPWGNNPGPDWMMWLFWVLFGIGLPVFFHILKLTVEVTPEHIFVGYRPLTKRIIPLSDVAARRGADLQGDSRVRRLWFARHTPQHGLQRQRQSRR